MYRRFARPANLRKRSTTDCEIRSSLGFTSVTCDFDPSPHSLACLVNIALASRQVPELRSIERLFRAARADCELREVPWESFYGCA